jgi:hypothetical protein
MPSLEFIRLWRSRLKEHSCVDARTTVVVEVLSVGSIGSEHLIRRGYVNENSGVTVSRIDRFKLKMAVRSAAYSHS